MPLLYALRDDLGLANPRFGCGLVPTQRGAGLIEVLIGVVIAGLVMIGATTGLLTAITTSGNYGFPKLSPQSAAK